MSGHFPRLTPPGDLVVSGHDVIELEREPIAPLEGDQLPHGTSPEWLSASQIQAESNAILYTYQGGAHDGALMEARGPDYIPQIIGRSGNVIAAGGGRWTVFEVVPSAGPCLRFDDSTIWAGYQAPAWNDDGILFACTQHATGLLLAGRPTAMQIVPGLTGQPVLGAREPAWRYGALCWEAGTRVYGRVTGDAPSEDLTLAEWEAKPIPIRTPGGWWLLSHDQTRVLLRPWGSSRGYVVFAGDSDGPHDARWDRFTETIRVVWSVKGRLHDARFRIDGALESRVDEPFVVDPTGVIEDTLPHVLGPYPAMARPDCATFIKSLTDAAYAEWWSFDPSRIYHEFDRTRQPGDLGWYLEPLPLWLPRRVQTGSTWAFEGEIVDLGGTPAPAGVHPFEFLARIDVAASGTLGGRPIAFVHTYDPRRREADSTVRLKGGYEKFIYGRPEDGLLRWEYWRTKDDNSGDELVHSADAGFPKGQTSLTPLPSPRPPDDEDDMPGYPDLQPIPRDQLLDTLDWLRFEVYTPSQEDERPGEHPFRLVPHPLDDEGIAAWLCDAYESVGRYRYGLSHQAAKDYVYREIQKVVSPPDPVPPPQVISAPIHVAARDFVR
jgi:hypothetical protein